MTAVKDMAFGESGINMENLTVCVDAAGKIIKNNEEKKMTLK